MPGTTMLENAVLQGNLDAAGFTILNLDLSGLELDKDDVGLGNVDNTSDLAKPISTATATALGGKEPLIDEGLTTQFLIGDKTWLTFGSLALENGITTKPLISVIGADPSSNGTLQARRSDGVAWTQIHQSGASVFGNILLGLSAANAGALTFENATIGVIKTNNASPIIFGTDGQERVRISLGLNVGGDPAGAGCINASDTITANEFVGGAGGLVGFVKNQIPAILNATSMPRLAITGVAGAGYINLAAQSSPPDINSPLIFATSLGRIAIQGALNAFNLSFATDSLTASRIWTILDATGSVPVKVAVPSVVGSSGIAGTIAFDASHAYFCTATNTWRRVALSTW